MILYSVLAALFICLLSLSGAVFYFITPGTLQKILPYIVALSTGILLSNSFVHLIPEAIEKTGSVEHVSLLTLTGILLFFFIEKSMNWKHYHDVYVQVLPGQSPAPVKSLGKMNLVGDFVHSFTDGAVIAGSFAVSPQLGIVSTIAVAAHEIPQEISDTGALLYSGYSLKRSLLLNFISSLSCLLGIAFIILLEQLIPLPIAYILPITAGGFIYIAVCDMMPELQGEFSIRSHIGQVVAILVGWLIMMATGTLERMLN